MTKRARSILLLRRKARRGPKAFVSDDDLVMLALWRKYLAPEPIMVQGDYALATALLECPYPAAREILGKPSHDHLRRRLRKIRGEIEDPYWEILVLVAECAKEAGLPFRLPDEAGAIKRFPKMTPQQFEFAFRSMMLVHMLKQRLKPPEFEMLMRHLSGKGWA